LSNDLSFSNIKCKCKCNGNGNGNSSNNSNNSSLSSTMEPKKDRRTMLEEWRAQNKAKEANKVLLSGSGTQHQHQLVQSRQQPVAQLLVDKENTYSLAHTSTETPSRLMSMLMSMPPPLPPSSSTESTTAVERFRMRYL